jgi:hypothetical protein
MENKNIREKRYKRSGGEEGYVGREADHERGELKQRWR